MLNREAYSSQPFSRSFRYSRSLSSSKSHSFFHSEYSLTTSYDIPRSLCPSEVSFRTVQNYQCHSIFSVALLLEISLLFLMFTFLLFLSIRRFIARFAPLKVYLICFFFFPG